MNSCLFCAFNEEVEHKVYEDDIFFIVNDIRPMASRHYLAIPRKHFKYFSEMNAEDIANFGKIFAKIAEIAEDVLKIEGGYRLVINQGDNAGQTVPHLHIHILGGQKMNWDPA